MIYLIAGNERQADFWMTHNLFPRMARQVCVLSNPDKLRGVTISDEDAVIRYGSWLEREDIFEIEDILARCKRRP